MTEYALRWFPQAARLHPGTGYEQLAGGRLWFPEVFPRTAPLVQSGGSRTLRWSVQSRNSEQVQELLTHGSPTNA